MPPLALTLILAFVAISFAGWLWLRFVNRQLAEDARDETAARFPEVRRDEWIGEYPNKVCGRHLWGGSPCPKCAVEVIPSEGHWPAVAVSPPHNELLGAPRGPFKHASNGNSEQSERVHIAGSGSR